MNTTTAVGLQTLARPVSGATRVLPTPAPRPPQPAPDTAAATGWRPSYLAVLSWAFTLFNSVRVAAYLPTVWAIFTSGDSSQHSLWTWCTWFGANLTMALWLRERNGGHFDRAAAVNLGNATMCGVTLVLIVWFRL